MLIESIVAVAEPGFLPPALQNVAPTSGFGNWFTNELNTVNTSLANVDGEVRQLALGETHNLHEVMIHMEQAKLSFQLLAQMRNHLLDAYQEVMRMQV